MNTMSRIVLWLSALVSVCAAGEALRELSYSEDVKLAGQVHVARHHVEPMLAVYLAIDNRFKNTIECGGQLLAAIEKDGEEVRLLVRFGNLRVYPSGAFPHTLVHEVGGRIELPDSYVFVAKEYQPIEVSCRGWNYHQYLHPSFCQQREEAVTCSGDKLTYPYKINEYWLGLCLC